MADETVAATVERDERRREPRQRLDSATVTIEGRDHAARDWSESGFLIDEYKGCLAAGDRTDVHMSVPSTGRTLEFACHAIVVRVDPKAKNLAGAFTRMDRATRVALQTYFREIDAEADNI